MELIKREHLNDINWARFSSSFIIEVTRGKEVFTSTAVAIGKNTLITAAHCVDCADEVALLIGDEYKNPDSVYTVEKWIIHPEYNPSKSLFENDLAILFMDEDLPPFVQYESLFADVELSKNSLMERIGFGGRHDENIRTWITPSFIGFSFNKKSLVFQDDFSVIGDSGGPIYTEREGKLHLVGLHSTLEGDNKTYAVNLSYYANWINELMFLEKVI